MRKTVWTVACGGYKEAGAKVFPSRKAAEDYMREEYEDQIATQNIEDTSMCFITDDYAEPYKEDMDFDDVFVFRLEEHEIEFPDEDQEDGKPKIYQLLREDAKYGTDISATFTAKNHDEAVRYAHGLALNALREDYADNPDADWEKAWIGFYSGNMEDDYKVVAGIDIDNIGDTVDYNVSYTLRKLDSVENCKHKAKIDAKTSTLLDILYMIEEYGILEEDLKDVFEMLKKGTKINKVKEIIEDRFKEDMHAE